MNLQELPILLVEDDENDVLLIRRAFHKAKVVNPLQVVSDGEAAVAYLRGEGPYADRRRFPFPVMVLLDLKLPKKDGHEVLEWIRAQEGLRRLPVVVLTSSGERMDVNRAYDLGANSYLVKPGSLDAVLELVNALGLYWLVLNEHPEIASH